MASILHSQGFDHCRESKRLGCIKLGLLGLVIRTSTPTAHTRRKKVQATESRITRISMKKSFLRRCFTRDWLATKDGWPLYPKWQLQEEKILRGSGRCFFPEPRPATLGSVAKFRAPFFSLPRCQMSRQAKFFFWPRSKTSQENPFCCLNFWRSEFLTDAVRSSLSSEGWSGSWTLPSAIN